MTTPIMAGSAATAMDAVAASAPEPASAPVAAPAAQDKAAHAIAVIHVRPPLDPLQPINRRLFRADQAIGNAFSRLPGAGGQSRPARNALLNAFSNLEEPATAANSALQRRPRGAFIAAARFLINSTLGVAGFVDVAGRMGIKGMREDFGRTLAMYGVKAGPYVYLPVLGPTTVRDFAGGMIDGLVSPTRLLHLPPMAGQAKRVVRYRLKNSELAAARAAQPAADDYAVVRARYLHGRKPQRDAPVSAPYMMASAGRGER